MRLLLINFQMDPESQVLGWQHRVAGDLARYCEHVTVVTHRDVGVSAGDNVKVEVLPARLMRAPMRWIGGKWMVNPRVRRLCTERRIDACFIHMNLEWAYRLYPTFRRLNIPVLLWYAHGATSMRLRLAHRCATRVVTSTAEGFRLPSSKLRVIGQGIDAHVFTLRKPQPARSDILTVSRIASTKRIHLMIEALASAVALAPEVPLRLRVIGEPIRSDDRAYARALHALVHRLTVSDRVLFIGRSTQREIATYHESALVHLNVSETGSMDKSVVEALATGCPVLTSNVALRELLHDFPEFVLTDDSPREIGERLLELFHTQEQYDGTALRALVVGQHDAESYAQRIIAQLTDMLSEGSKSMSESAVS